MEKQDELPDYYQILNVDRNVDDNKLYAAYTVMVKKYALPPGVSPGVEHRRDLEFAIYEKAYNILSNPRERKQYDLQLKLIETRKEEEKVQLELDKNEAERKKQNNDKNIDFQAKSPIKNDPRLRDTMTGFNLSQFKIVDIDKDKLDQVQKEREQHEKIIADEKFIKAKQFLDKGKDDSAIDLLKELVEKYPKVANYHSYLGLAMQSKGWAGYSQAEFKVALHFDPMEPIALKYYNTPAQKQAAKPEEKKSGFFSNLFRKK